MATSCVKKSEKIGVKNTLLAWLGPRNARVKPPGSLCLFFDINLFSLRAADHATLSKAAVSHRREHRLSANQPELFANSLFAKPCCAFTWSTRVGATDRLGLHFATRVCAMAPAAKSICPAVHYCMVLVPASHTVLVPAKSAEACSCKLGPES